MKVYVDPSLCTGSGLCQETCPEVFELNNEGISTVKANQVLPKFQRACRQAADNCPSNAISVEE